MLLSLATATSMLSPFTAGISLGAYRYRMQTLLILKIKSWEQSATGKEMTTGMRQTRGTRSNHSGFLRAQIIGRRWLLGEPMSLALSEVLYIIHLIWCDKKIEVQLCRASPS